MQFQNIPEEDKNEISKDIEFNVAQEAMARDYYYTLLNKVADEHKEEIKGIIEDEINHSIILMRMAELYSGNEPTEFPSLFNLRRKEEE